MVVKYASWGQPGAYQQNYNRSPPPSCRPVGMPADMCRTGGGERDCAGGAGRRTGAGDNLLIQCIPVLLLRTLQSARAAERRWRRFLPEGSVHLFPIQSLRRRSLVFLLIGIFLCPPLLLGTCERIAALAASRFTSLFPLLANLANCSHRRPARNSFGGVRRYAYEGRIGNDA